MQISILTPVYEPGPALEGCLQSVFRQARELEGSGISLSHVVQDGGNDDLTEKLCRDHQNRVRESGMQHVSFIWSRQPDQGMYDALNKAYQRTSGEVIGHVNADEQYVPGTLQRIAGMFQKASDLEVLIGATVIVDAAGDYLCSRLPVLPRKAYVQRVQLPIFTASTFYRRTLIERLGLYFDTRYQCVGDSDLILRMLDHDACMEITSDYAGLFHYDGANLSCTPQAKEEQASLSPSKGGLDRLSRLALRMGHVAEKWKAGCYRPEPFSYEAFFRGNWRTVQVNRPRGRWKLVDLPDPERAS